MCIRDSLYIRVALESLRRLCEYGADIAEIAIDIMIGKESLAESP